MKKNYGVYVARNDINSQQMQILAYDEFKRMYVYGVQIASRRGFLLVMMLVNVLVDAPDVQDAVKPHVKEVIEGVKGNQRPQGIHQCDILCAHFMLGVLYVTQIV